MTTRIWGSAHTFNLGNIRPCVFRFTHQSLKPWPKVTISYRTGGRVGPSSGPDLVAKIKFTSCLRNLIPKFYPAEYFYAVSGSPAVNSVVYFEK